MAFLISLSNIISSSTTMRMSDALLHAQTENRRNTPKKYLSVFFIEASLDFIKDKILFWGNIYFFCSKGLRQSGDAIFRLKSPI